MRSDVPIGSLLSGGLDSSAIYSVMAQISTHQKNEDNQRIGKGWQHAFTAAFPGSPLDETEYARLVTQHYQQPLDEININDLNDIDKLKEYSYLFEDIYITNPIPMVEVYKKVKKSGITVTLDGHGADEYLGGYSSSTFEAFFDAYTHNSEMNMIYSAYKGITGGQNNQNVYFELLKFIVRKVGIKGINLLQNLPIVSKHQFVPIDMAPKLEHMDYFTSHLYNTFHTTIMPTLLRNYDRYSMIASVESRMPLMDHRLVTFAFSLPWTSKLRNGFTKSILRDASKPYMPTEVNGRKLKIGFTSPIADWIKGPWKEYMLDTINSKDFAQCELIEPNYIRKRVERIMKNKTTSFGESQDTWRYFSTYLWYSNFYKRVN
jgi:asparagine synthase (glutamine-hydrolysing)